MSEPAECLRHSLALKVQRYQNDILQPEQLEDHRLALEGILAQLSALGFFLSVVDEKKLASLRVEDDSFEKYGQMVMMLADEAVDHHNSLTAHYDSLKPPNQGEQSQ